MTWTGWPPRSSWVASMLPEEVGRLAAIVEQVNWLRDEAAGRLSGAGWKGVPPDPGSLWPLQVRWNQRVDRLVADQELSGRVHDILHQQLGVLVSQVSNALQNAATGPRSQLQSAALEAVDAWRRSWNARAQKVTITETTRILAQRELDSPEAARPGAHKRWESRDDDRVRESHQVADGQTVPLPQPFQVGGSWLMHPGDPAGVPQETVGCRCRLHIVTPKR